MNVANIFNLSLYSKWNSGAGICLFDFEKLFQPSTLLKMRLRDRCFPVNFAASNDRSMLDSFVKFIIHKTENKMISKLITFQYCLCIFIFSTSPNQLSYYHYSDILKYNPPFLLNKRWFLNTVKTSNIPPSSLFYLRNYLTNHSKNYIFMIEQYWKVFSIVIFLSAAAFPGYPM